MALSRLSRAAIVAAMLSTPLNARAQTLPGGTFCFPGAFQACANVFLAAIQLSQPTAATFPYFLTTLTFRTTNLQGQPGVPSSGPYGIFMLTLTNTVGCANFDGNSGYPADCYSGVAHMVFHDGAIDVNQGQPVCSGSACTQWPWDETEPRSNSFSVSAQGSFYSMILGCSHSDAEMLALGGTEDGSTCSGYIDIVATVIGNMQITDASRLQVEGVYANGPDSQAFLQCTIDVDCLPSSAIPEPASGALLGTGLAVMAFARVRSRKKEPIGVA